MGSAAETCRIKAVSLTEVEDLEKMKGEWMKSGKGVGSVKRVGVETREKKLRRGIGRLVLRRQVTEIPSEKNTGN